MANWASNGGGSSGGSSSSSWVTKTSNYTAAAGDNIFADTSGGVFTITLPASPAANDTVQIADLKQTFDISVLSINPNGGKIDGWASNQTVFTPGVIIELTYVDSTTGWRMRQGGEPTFCRWDNIQAYPAAFIVGRDWRSFSVAANTSGGWRSIFSNKSRSSGKYYFEMTVGRVAGTFSPMIGVGDASSPTGSFVGSDTHGVGQVMSGDVYYNNVSAANSAISAGDVVGVAVDFAGGSVSFYKNNVANGSKTGLTLSSPLFPIGSGDTANAASANGKLCTTAQQCTYSPPAGYSYWDS